MYSDSISTVLESLHCISRGASLASKMAEVGFGVGVREQEEGLLLKCRLLSRHSCSRRAID